MSEKDSNLIISQSNRGVVADAQAIKAPILGDRIAYRQVVEAYKSAIDSGAPMNLEDIIGAAEFRQDPIESMETDASVLQLKVGIKDYPDGSFIGVFDGGIRVIISGELQAPISTQIVPTETNLVPIDNQQVATVDVIKGIGVFSSNQDSFDLERDNSLFLKKAA